MYRSMMQMFVKGSSEAVEVYKRAFNAELLCAFPNDDGGYMHAELNACGQILAISEIMMFCFHFGDGGEENVKIAYEELKGGANIHTPIGPCDFSTYMFGLFDKFGIIGVFLYRK